MMAAPKRLLPPSPAIRSKRSKKSMSTVSSLPITSCRSKLLQYASKHTTLIVVGETGSGKTTQMPQMLLNLNRASKVAVTQPRRVAAISVAQRVAHELNVQVGQLVGYKVRFETAVDESITRLIYLTDGMLLREAMLDPTLSSYTWVVLDEAHERSIETDVLMAVVKRAQRLRMNSKKALRVVIMSATLEAAPIADFFCSDNNNNNNELPAKTGLENGSTSGNLKGNNVLSNKKQCLKRTKKNTADSMLPMAASKPPILYILGRQHKISIRYLRTKCEGWQRSLTETVLRIHTESDINEHVLVFMTGQEEIEATVKQIKSLGNMGNKMGNKMEVYGLYASQQWQQQQRVFSQPQKGVRRIVVATNIAETSVTIPGIKHVVDSCRVKTKVHEPTSGLDVLRVVRISKAQAVQRAGRAGRESDGNCYRIITKEEYESLPAESVPEILRSNLSSVMLHLLSIGIEDLESFDFIQRPPLNAIRGALRLLRLLGALDSKHSLSVLGTKLALLPLEPRLAKTVLCAEKLGCTEEVISIVALLSGDSVLLSAHNRNTGMERVETLRKRFVAAEGDLITLLKLFRAYKASNNKTEWCQEHMVHGGRMKFAMEVRSQLIQLCNSNSIAVQSCGNNMQLVCRAIAQGLFTNVARLNRAGDYVTVDTKQSVKLHPSSVLFSSKPEVVVFIELMVTQRSYIRNLTVVDPRWLIETQPEYFKQNRLLNNLASDQ